jgi:hypothetical protein
MTSWQTAATVAAAILGSGLISVLLRSRSQNQLDESNSAEVLARAYSVLVDDLRKGLARQDEELKEMRAMLRERGNEIASVRDQLTEALTENGKLRERVTALEAQAGA